MAFENLFIRVQRSIGGIQLDAVISEGHTNTVRLTKNPVEFGADITDHAIVEPKKLVIIAEASDTPLGVAAFNQIIDLITGLFGTSTAENLTRSNTAYNALVQIQAEREPMDVQTRLVNYRDMVITSLTTVQDKDSSRIASMVITFDQVLITESEIVQLQPDQLQDGSATQQGSPVDKVGRKEPVEVSPATNRSFLQSLIKWVQG